MLNIYLYHSHDDQDKGLIDSCDLSGQKYKARLKSKDKEYQQLILYEVYID